MFRKWLILAKLRHNESGEGQSQGFRGQMSTTCKRPHLFLGGGGWNTYGG